MPQFDYVIVGAGAAGCVLAARLSENPATRVLLLESGADLVPGAEPADVLDPFPSSYYNKRYYWPGLRTHWRNRHNSPAVHLQQGRGVGGGGSVMGMVALRGTPADYDGWQALGARGWGWADVLPHFVRLESDRDFGGDLHGREGPIPVRRTPEAQWPPLARAARDFAAARGLPHVVDMNGDFRDGYGSVPMSNTLERRASSGLCHLAPARTRPNLAVQAGAHVTRVLFSGGVATGVEALVSGERKTYTAGQTILSAGAIFSPAILMRSGIGPAETLSGLGIPVTRALPGVGRNLQNHPQLFVGLRLARHARQPESLRTHHVTCFRVSSGWPGAGSADLYIHVVSKTSWNALGRQIGSFAPYLLRPDSRGRVEILSPDPMEPPRIEFNFMDEDSDVQKMMRGFSLAVQAACSDGVRALAGAPFPIRATDRIRSMNERTRPNALKASFVAGLLDAVPPLADFALGQLTGRRVDLQALLDRPAELAQLIRDNVSGTFHPAGTCRMGGAGDPAAVTDPQGRVHGVGQLRVIDASIMPTLIRGNTNIPTIMIAEKIAAAIAAER